MHFVRGCVGSKERLLADARSGTREQRGRDELVRASVSGPATWRSPRMDGIVFDWKVSLALLQEAGYILSL